MDRWNECLQQMKQRCVVNEDEYWDVELLEGETPIEKECNDTTLCLRTKDAFHIRIRHIYDDDPVFFNGYITLPSGPQLYHLTSWIQEHSHYEDMNHLLLPYNYNQNNNNNIVELTYRNHKKMEYGWDHCHFWDADFGKPLWSQEHKYPSGPVQVLEEARDLIRMMTIVDNTMFRQRMDDKRQQTDELREQLMMKIYHPDRVDAWLKAGFDPFE